MSGARWPIAAFGVCKQTGYSLPLRSRLGPFQGSPGAPPPHVSMLHGCMPQNSIVLVLYTVHNKLLHRHQPSNTTNGMNVTVQLFSLLSSAHRTVHAVSSVPAPCSTSTTAARSSLQERRGVGERQRLNAERTNSMEHKFLPRVGFLNGRVAVAQMTTHSVSTRRTALGDMWENEHSESRNFPRESMVDLGRFL